MELPAVLDEGLYAHTDRYMVEEESDGAVNTTLYVDDTVDGERYVVQTNPAERWRVQKSVHLLADLAHTDARAPRLVHDGSNASVPYYIMERSPGASLREGYRERGVAAAVDVAEQVGAALGAAHTQVDVDVHGYGRLSADAEGLIPYDGAPTWREGLAAQATVWLDKLDDVSDRAVIEQARETMGAALSRLPEEPDRALLHCDCRPGNVLYEDGAVTAVLDWDNATVGDPLYDQVRTEDAFADWFGADSTEVREAFREGYAQHREPLDEGELRTVYRFASFLDKVGGCAFLVEADTMEPDELDQMLDWLEDREAAARDTLEQL